MTIDTVAVAGGSGKIGRRAVREFADAGHRTINLDVQRPDEQQADAFVETDLLDAGEVYGALAKEDADAVAHLGTLPHPLHDPEHVTFENNVTSTYHVLEAATALDLESVCLPSSINALGYHFQEAPTEIEYLPVDENHPRTPRDPYGIAKHVIEVTADGFGRRSDAPATISSVRFPYVATTEEMREHYLEADRSLSALREEFEPDARPLFAYVHVDDAARAVRLAIEADHEGHEQFWIVADDTTASADTAALVEEFYADVETRTDFSGHEGLVSNRKADKCLDWHPEMSWRDLD